MNYADYLLVSIIAVGAGLDRVAFLQSMFSRPIVAAPLTGWVLGNPMVGLEIGVLLELLWLGRLPVGASIPPDDTQVAIGATVLSLSMEQLLGMSGMPVVILCVMTAIPLGKCGQYFDRLARHANGLVDTDLGNTADNFLGVDLNRNNLHGFGQNGGSSSDPISLVHHGLTIASEPEIAALQAAAALGPASQLRLFVDVHSFSQIYFTPLTGNARRDELSIELMQRMRAVTHFKYRDGRSSANAVGRDKKR